MKLELILLIIINLCLSSCDKDDNSSKYGYPDGVNIVDTTSENDCTLPKCSDNRVTRLLANNVLGKLYQLSPSDSTYFINYAASFDSQIQFVICELPDEFKKDISTGLDIKFSGKLQDACGQLTAVWPIEEIYLLKLTKIEKQ